MLLQLRDGRQQLLALVTTEGQLQELGHPVSDGHSASLLHHLNHSCKGKMFRVQLLWKAKIQKLKKKKENLIPNIPSILKSSKREVTLTVGKICLVRF